MLTLKSSNSHSMDEIPKRFSDYHCNNVRGLYRETLTLSTLCLSNIQWQKHSPSTNPPATQHPSISNPSKAYNGGSFYTAMVTVPITLPKGNKVLVPSFHSCLVSRMYELDLYLSLNTPSATLTDPKVHLKLPLHVSSEGNPETIGNVSAHVRFNLCYPNLVSDLRLVRHSLTLVVFDRDRPLSKESKQTPTLTLMA